MSRKKIIRWGIVGCGDVTEKKSGPALSKIEGSRLVAVMRRDGAKARDYAERHGVPIWLDDADALIHHPEVDAVYVATPPGSHAELALKVAAAGKPCYVEKPMGASAAQARAMVAAFEAARQPLFVAYYRRALPWFVWMHEAMTSGLIGEVTELRYRFSGTHYAAPGKDLGWRGDAATSGGGLFVDLGSHALDLFDFWFGPLRHVRAWNRPAPSQPGQPVVAQQVGMLFEVDRPGADMAEELGAEGQSLACSATWNFACTEKSDLIEIFGRRGTLRTGLFSHGPVVYETAYGKRQEYTFEAPEHIQQPLLQTVMHALQMADERYPTCTIPSRSTGYTALRTNEIMDLVVPERVAAVSAKRQS
ncbi:oxidoreductase [Verrucomicrobia bacterium LW23]|nr:oxidoreductase [Verrucomicrobia bacterium LW23]